MAETTIELKVAITKVIQHDEDPTKATVAADKAVRQILSKLDNCDQVKVLEHKRFPDNGKRD